ncbi:hypothetical protein MZM54_23450 [[Brevibacterium] frigoritolerans]|nr:hypothetical protein [Peribacillus frigoritolerans]
MKLSYPSWFYTVNRNGWRKFATLLPKYRLAETPERFTLMRLGRQSAERERISEIGWTFLNEKQQSNSLFFEFV